MAAAFFRNRVVAFSAPGITADDALHSEPSAIEQSVFLQCLYHVMGAGGRISADRRQNRGYGNLIEPHKKYKRRD